MKITRRKFITSSIAGGIGLIVYQSANHFTKRNKTKYTPVVQKTRVAGKKTHKVVSVHSSKATNWDYKSYPYVDAIDYSIVETMLNKGLMELTLESSPASAWESLFYSYRDGDSIVIKPNFNDLYKEFRENLVVSPSVINAVLGGLIESLGISPSNITLYDCTRDIPDSFRTRVRYPINYVEPYGEESLWRKIKYHSIGNPLPKADFGCEIKMSQVVKNKRGEPVKCYLPKVVTSAQHIINIPILKSHQFVLASGSLKNHYGTVRFSDGHGAPEYLHPPIIHESIADLNNHPQIREKTRLIVMDALFGRLKKKGGSPDKWKIFDGSNPNRLFLAQDTVALDTVTSDIIKEELKKRGEDYFSDDYLKIASEKGIGAFKGIDHKYVEI